MPQPNALSAPAARALSSPTAWIVLLLTIVIGLTLDLWSKAYAFERVAGAPVVIRRADVLSRTEMYGPQSIKSLIPAHPPVTVVSSLLDFTLVLNPGAVFGIGPGKRWFFITFTVGAMLAGLGMFAWGTKPSDRPAHLAIGLLIAGGLGNFYDRLAFGCVRDFIHPVPAVWPYVSNVADLWLLIGIGALVVLLWRRDGEKREATAAAESPTPSDVTSAPPPPPGMLRGDEQ